MTNSLETQTSTTLLFRLRNESDQEAWDTFVERYTPKIYGWCRRFSLQETDAADVTQEVLCKLVRAMRTFEYDPKRGSFRGWLKTVTSNAVSDLFQSWKKPVRGSGDEKIAEMLASIQDPQAFDQLVIEIEKEAEHEILDEASCRVRLRVKPHTWDAYQLTAVEQIPAPEAAKQLNLSVSDVYVAKSRVIKMLQQEVLKLNHGGHHSITS